MNLSWSGKGPTENQMYSSPDELHSPQGENKKAALISPWRIRKLASPPLPLPYYTGLKDLWGWRRRLFFLPLSWVFPYSNSPRSKRNVFSLEGTGCLYSAREATGGNKNLFPIEICGKLLREMLGDLVIGIPYSMGRLHFFVVMHPRYSPLWQLLQPPLSLSPLRCGRMHRLSSPERNDLETHLPTMNSPTYFYNFIFLFFLKAVP